MFEDRILAHDAEVTDAVLHIGDDVGSLGEHDLKVVVADGQDQPSALVSDLVAVVADFFKQFYGRFFQSALGEGDS